jgi:subtilisin family serine protease
MNANTDTAYYPAACRHVIAVGATNPDDTRSAPFFWDKSSGSNYGKHITVVAPGNFIYGIDPEGYDTYWGGTSQAAPYVSGLAALLIAQDPSRTADEIIDIIKNTADDGVGNPSEDKPGWDQYYGYGRINAYKALSFGASVLRK